MPYFARIIAAIIIVPVFFGTAAYLIMAAPIPDDYRSLVAVGAFLALLLVLTVFLYGRATPRTKSRLAEKRRACNINHRPQILIKSSNESVE